MTVPVSLRHLPPQGDADFYELTAPDGSVHRIVVSNAQKAVAADGGAEALREAIAAIARKLAKAST